MASFLSSVFIWGAIIVIAIRMLTQSGRFTVNNNILGYITESRLQNNSFDTTKKEMWTVFGLSFLFRAIVFFISFLAIYLFKDGDLDFSGWLETYRQWDAHNYLRIAEGGYSFHVENGAYTTLAFFPLYPWLLRIVDIFIQNDILSGILLSSSLYSGACVYLYKLMSLDYNKSTAIRAIVFMSVFPHSFFFGTVMNESMLLITSIATLYYTRTHRWNLVGIFGALAAMSRMAGIMLAIPAAIEWFEEYEIIKKLKEKKIKDAIIDFLTKGLWIFLMLLGTFVYLWCNYKTTGEWFKFLEYQKTVWHHSAAYFGRGIQLMWDQIGDGTTYTVLAIWVPQLVSVIFAIATLVYGLRRSRNMYTGFLVAMIIINTGFDWVLSTARYMTCAVPAFMFLADFSDRHKWAEHLITATMSILFGIYFVAYFMSRQIL